MIYLSQNVTLGDYLTVKQKKTLRVVDRRYVIPDITEVAIR